MASTREDFERIARETGVPTPMPASVQRAYAAEGLAVPEVWQSVSLALGPAAGTCSLDGFDCRLCDARSAHDVGPVAQQKANREQQWELAAAIFAVREDHARLATLGQEMQQLKTAAAAIQAQRESLNMRQGHSHCVHCGDPVANGQHAALHAPAGFERMGLRMEAVHCDACAHSEHCAFDQPAPGTGLPAGAIGGYCEFPGQAVTLGAVVLPGLQFLPRALRLLVRGLRLTLAVSGLFVAGTLLVHSQGQMVADLEGTTGAIAVQDSTSGHGYNAGTVAFFSGSAPADANAAETGTDLVDVTLPNPLMGVPAGFPSVATANAISSGTISNTNTAGYGRVKANGTGTGSSTTDRRLQITVGTSGADANFNTLSLVASGTLTITSFTYQHAN